MNFFSLLLLTLSLLPYSFVSAAQVVHFPSSDGTKLYGEYYPAHDAHSILLVVHGLQSHAAWYMNGNSNAARGISSFAFDRRGSGRSQGMRGNADGVQDFHNDLAAALRLIRENNRARLPVHVMANSLGAVVTLNYLARSGDRVDSLILTSPGTHSTSQGDYPFLTKLAILASPATRYFRSPIKDEDFVEPGPFLDWIKKDNLGTRSLTAGFLRAVNSMKSDIEEDAAKLSMPLFLLLAKGDEIIDNLSVYNKIYQTYRGPKKYSLYDSKHYLFFGQDRKKVSEDIQSWILGGWEN